MSYEFTKLSDVPVVAEFPEGANAVIETNGEIKRCPSGGGGGGIELITLTQSGETFVASKNSGEIAALIDGGKLSMLIVPAEIASAATSGQVSTGVYMLPVLEDGTSIAGVPGFLFSASGMLLAAVDSTGITTIIG